MARVRVHVGLLWFLAGAVNAGEPVLSAASYGDVVFGEPLDAVVGKLGERARTEYGDAACRYIRFERYEKARFMVEEGILTRVDVEASVPNPYGVSVGTRLEELRMRYPAARIDPHKYDPDGHYVVFEGDDGKGAVVLEVGNGRVTSMRAGISPSVHYVEGCL